MRPNLLDVEHVNKIFTRGGFVSRRVNHAVNDVSFSLAADKPEVFTIIGESGSGKTTLAGMILNSLSPTSGRIRFRGKDLREIRSRRARLEFMSHVQAIFQNPFDAFNPLKRVDRYLFSAAQRFVECRTSEAAAERADEALHKVGLSLAEVRGRYPHEMSGGQLQRVAIARALVSNPSLIVADEPVSMIDASLRVTVINLFRKLRDEFGVSIIYITHDLATAYYISDRLIIMQKGRVVEGGDARTVLAAPQHPYSIKLRQAVLSVDDAWRDDTFTGGMPATAT
ncbi:ABC transporter ATP-binding protein [Microvirga lotononidis]|uniref:ATPase component of various ABC-type transport systems with duplicated ATPase domain n=1 Tax=Microvirga lotononidis TaxID=864069 RepID=I4YWR8_9HYPH|nr:ABC transporter ATP-binding protein [Microvirga lotononidis]EIM28410.1 ATPase component of various ABC-type transport systems with duplicated ATPase domain [Microvirga lotononidis]WQO27508.1 ABC transporter ATP-binding protein [Microvirga lotononidis]